MVNYNKYWKKGRPQWSGLYAVKFNVPGHHYRIYQAEYIKKQGVWLMGGKVCDSIFEWNFID